MNSESEKLTFSFKNGGKLVEIAKGSFFSSKSQKVYQIRSFRDFIYDFIRDCPATAVSIPL